MDNETINIMVLLCVARILDRQGQTDKALELVTLAKELAEKND